MAKRTTLQDLADELNTSPSTVSRALRGESTISDSMIEKVRELAKLRHYKVNRIAANLRSGKSKSLGVIVPRINRDFFSNCIAGIEEIAYQAGYSIIICQTHETLEKEKAYINALISSDVEGILISISAETNEYKHLEMIENVGIPLVFFDRAALTGENNSVVVDDRGGAYRAVSHLIEMGYRRIAHFAGQDHIPIYINRKKGYLEALQDHGIPIDEDLIVSNTLTEVKGRERIAKLLRLKNPPDALFSASDYSALGAILYLKENNYAIPQDFGIVGFSNEMFTSLISPSLTSVDQYSKDIGQYAARMCLDKIQNVNSPLKVVIEPKLIVRESTLRKK